MNLEDLPEQGSAPERPADAGIGWADYEAARERFFAARRRQDEIVRLEATFAAPAHEPGPAAAPEGN